MPEPIAEQQPSGETPTALQRAAERRRPRFHRFADVLLVILIMGFAVSQVLIWNAWNPAMGDSLKNLITYAQGILVTFCVIGWWFFCSPFSRRTVLIAGLPVVTLLAGWMASIRRIDFSGDMVISIVYRWEPAPEQVLEVHRRSVKGGMPAALADRLVPVAGPEDMPAYRGINRDGVVVGPPLNQDWQSSPPRELWRQPVGAGYSSFGVVEPYAVTLEQRGHDEAVVGYDTNTGRELWQHRYAADFQEAMGGPGPRSTPTIHEDSVYAFGAFGDLFCLDLLTGQVRWHVNVLQQFGLPNTMWAMACSPLVTEGNVIVNIGGMEGNGLVAYSLRDGALTWFSGGLPEPNRSLAEFQTGADAVENLAGKTRPGYSSPMLAFIHGDLQIVNFDGTALRGHQPQDGTELWTFPFQAGDSISVAQPIVFEDGRVLISASYGTGATMVQVSRNGAAWSATQLWNNLNMKCKFSSPVLYNGYLYGLDEGIMVCLDPRDGRRMWKQGRYGHGQILLTNGQVLVLAENGEAVLVAASPEGFQEITRMRVLPEGKTWNPPVLVRGRLYVRNTNEMACFDMAAR